MGSNQPLIEWVTPPIGDDQADVAATAFLVRFDPDMIAAANLFTEMGIRGASILMSTLATAHYNNALIGPLADLFDEVGYPGRREEN